MRGSRKSWQSSYSLGRRHEAKTAGGRRGFPCLGVPAVCRLARGRGVSAGPAGGNGNGGWRLPRGPHRLPPEVVSEHQRSRLLAGAARAVSTHGYAALTVEQIIEEAGVSRTTFYEHFDNKRDCVLVAHAEIFDRLSSAIFRACASEREWAVKVAASIEAAIGFAAKSPEEASLLVLDVVAADRALAARAIASGDHLAGLLRAGREHCPDAASLPELTERALVGAAMSVIGARLMTGQADRLPELAPQLVHLILMPYLGPDGARQAAAATI